MIYDAAYHGPDGGEMEVTWVENEDIAYGMIPLVGFWDFTTIPFLAAGSRILMNPPFLTVEVGWQR